MPEPPETPEALPESEPESTPERLAQAVLPDPSAKSRILVLRSGDAENYRDVAAALLNSRSDEYVLHEVNLADADGRRTAERISSLVWSAAVAIGEEAAEFAASELDIPTVFCQIFDYGLLIESNERLFGVEPLPPLKLQLESWQRLSPDAKTVGIIVTEKESDLVEQAQEIAAELGLVLHPAFAATDQDAVYQFKRFAQTVDALWLYPNSAILSPTSIREILDYAAGHDVQTIVFNKALLDWGGLLSVGSSTDDVAATVAEVLDDLVEGRTGGADRMIPLSEVEFRVNEETARKLGITLSPSILSEQKLLTALDNES